jgi:hypothetical protein
MTSLELIEENSDSCPVESATGSKIPLLLIGAVGVIAIAGIAYAGSRKVEKV